MGGGGGVTVKVGKIPYFFMDFFFTLPLVGLGDLKTWRKIDYYDPDSNKFFKNDSEFMKLQKHAQESNWEFDFNIENCDFLR